MATPSENIQQNSIRAWILAARPKTLTAAAVPVMVGAALAWKDAAAYEEGTFQWTAALLCLLFAFVMQIDANFINDFFDYINGADDKNTRLGPERACTQGWVTLNAMKNAIAGTTCVACLVGLPLIWFGGWEMIAVGAFCILFCFLYTTHLARLGLGDLLVLLFFGLVPVTMTYYVQLHTITVEVVVASIAVGLVIDGLLLVNNFRDRHTDAAVGKTTLVVRVGEQAGIRIFLLTGIAAVMLMSVFAFYGNWMPLILSTLYLVCHVFTYLDMKRIWTGRELNACLAEAARNIFIFGLLITIGILL